MKYKEWIRYSKKILNLYNKNIFFSEIIISNFKKISREYLYIKNNNYLNNYEIDFLNKLLKKIIIGIPIEYVLEKVEFWSKLFKINNMIFIPRKETESIIEFILNNIKNYKKYKILDLGTGCGIIPIILSNEIKNSQVLGIDINLESIRLSNINKLNLCKNNKNINFLYSNWFSNINDSYDIIVSNPPYLSCKEFNNIKYKILFDPINSIVSENNSLYNIKKIILNSKKYLKNNGLIILEHGKFQGKHIRKIFKKFNYKNINTYYDYNHIERFTIGIN